MAIAISVLMFYSDKPKYIFRKFGEVWGMESAKSVSDFSM